AFDVRNAETKKYYKEYSYYEVEPATPAIISTTHTISDAKIVFTIITKPGDFGRIKVTTADNLKGSLGIASKYTVNTDGNYVWTIKADAPTEHTSYAFDLRNANTGSYMKEYYYYTAEAKTPAILSVNHEIADNKIILTVTTKAGNYDRIKATLADNLGGSIAVATSYTIDADGNYVWTIKTNAPTEATDYAFDLRINGGRYIKDYYYYTV
ncbi:MAG: hypothetical protein IKV89_00385, partial [Clostridia bacterium]|nr:hypothetical protein [Clostridia bacterium]